MTSIFEDFLDKFGRCNVINNFTEDLNGEILYRRSIDGGATFGSTIDLSNDARDLALFRNSISSATEEIMIMFPTIRSFQVYEREGILNLIKRQLENRITVRIMVAEKDHPSEGIWQEISSTPNLQIQYSDQLPSSRLTMVIIDNELSLVIEEKKYEDRKSLDSIRDQTIVNFRTPTRTD